MEYTHRNNIYKAERKRLNKQVYGGEYGENIHDEV